MREELTTLRNFQELIVAQLDITEPAALDDGCSVASVSPVKGVSWDSKWIPAASAGWLAVQGRR
jgi:hypothetical protein